VKEKTTQTTQTSSTVNFIDTAMEPEEELLVAYLDGELNADEVQGVQERLGQDSNFRDKMASLEQTWNMLDALETVPVDKSLVRSTMEILVADVEKELQEKEKSEQKRKIPDFIFKILAFVLIGLIGFQLAVLWRIYRVGIFLHDIPIIEKLEQYQQIDNIEILQELSDQKIFEDRREP
jgi:hypothetical protein